MLILTRRPGESVKIGDDITVTVLGVRGNQLRLGFSAPQHVAVHREEVYKRDREDLKGVAELILAKQRNGPVGKIDLVFLHHLTKFENRLEDIGESGED